MQTAIRQDNQVVPLYGARMLKKVLDITTPTSVLDVGVGRGTISKLFAERDYSVTGISLSNKPFKHDNYRHVKKRFEDTNISTNIVWCSHTLEHIPNVGDFLIKCRKSINDNGLFCITVPSDPTDLLIDGHLSFWTPAHLIYNLVIAGFDCSEAKYYTEYRDISLMVRKKERPLIELNYDKGDYEKLQPYFPCELTPRKTNPWLEDNW